MEYKYRGLVEPLLELPGMEEALKYLRKGKNIIITDIVNACKGHLGYSLSQFTNAPIVLITYDELSTKQLAEDLEVLKGKESVLIYPARDILFYSADVHSMDITAQRLKVMDALVNQKDVTVIIPIEALLNPLSPKETFEAYMQQIEVGGSIDLSKLEARLVQMGYERVARVEAMGQFSIRGGIIDIYGAASEEAYRLDLWDDEVDSIRNFNIQTQRSVNKVEKIKIMPNQEIIFPLELIQKAIPSIREDLKQTVSKLREEGKKDSALKIEEHVKEVIEQISENMSPRGLELYVPYTDLKLVSILDYIPSESLLIVDEPIKVKEKSNRVLEEYRMSMEDRLNYGHILPKQIELIFTYEDVIFKMNQFRQVLMMNFGSDIEDIQVSYNLSIKVFENNTFYKNLDLLEKDLKEWKADKKRVAILTGVKAKALRLCDELEERGVITSYTENDETVVLPGQILIYKGYLTKGFSYSDLDFYVIADKDLFGKEKHQNKRKKKYKGTKIQSFLELSPGDYVVHEQYGIGVFQGLELIVVEGISKDNLKIEYADHNYLYVNINQIDLKSGKVLIYGEKTNAYRTVMLDDIAIKYLSEYLTKERKVSLSSEENLFTYCRGDRSKPLGKAGVYAEIKRIAERSELPKNRRVYPHLFRKTTATNIIKMGGTIEDAGFYLGHKPEGVTAKHYAFMGEQHTQKIFKNCIEAI